MPVLDAGKVVGVVSIGDVVEDVIRDLELNVVDLTRYSPVLAGGSQAACSCDRRAGARGGARTCRPRSRLQARTPPEAQNRAQARSRVHSRPADPGA